MDDSNFAWEALVGPSVGHCWRVVETQEIAATRNITNSAEEQSRLEELLDQSKPVVPPDCNGLLYLLMTPFRYPPLDYGSRFGSKLERGIFYGSVELPTAFAEISVYFWLFQSGPIEVGPLEKIRDQRTAFSVRLSSQKSVDLSSETFFGIRNKICQPDSWRYTQKLGAELRSQGVEFIRYPSARLAAGNNVAVLSPRAFASREPDQMQNWNIQFTSTSCWFGLPGGQSIEYAREDFQINGRILHPSL